MVRSYSSSVRLLLFTGFALTMGPGLIQAQNWVPDTIGLSQSVWSLAVSGNGDIFAGSVNAGVGGIVSPTGVYLSINNGKSWTQCPNPSGNTVGPVYGVDAKNEVIAGGGYEQYLSTNSGSTWTSFRIEQGAGQDPEIDPTSKAFIIGFPGYMWAASNGGPLWYTSDYDYESMWVNQGVDNGNEFDFPTFVAYNPAGFLFSGSSTELFKSDGSNGGTWGSGQNNEISGAPSSGFGNSVHFAFNSTGYGNNSTIIVAGGTNGLFLSTDNGINWTAAGSMPGFMSGTTYFALAIGTNGNIYAGLSTGGMLVSTDTGQSWNDISPGLPNGDTVNALAIAHDSTLYAGTNNGVFKYLTSTAPGHPSGVTPNASAPASLTLRQNTPNPVTASTDIQFTVPEAGHVSLNVFDPTGREVATVANGFYAPGTYNVSFDAHGLANGAYYYRIESGGQNASRMFVIEH